MVKPCPRARSWACRSLAPAGRVPGESRTTPGRQDSAGAREPPVHSGPPATNRPKGRLLQILWGQPSGREQREPAKRHRAGEPLERCVIQDRILDRLADHRRRKLLDWVGSELIEWIHLAPPPGKRSVCRNGSALISLFGTKVLVLECCTRMSDQGNMGIRLGRRTADGEAAHVSRDFMLVEASSRRQLV